LDLLEELHREFNSTLLLVTHNEDAARRCDRILTIRDGVIIGEEILKRGESGAQ